MNLRQPIYLLADSRLLFDAGPQGLLLGDVGERLSQEPLRAAYIGAANGDDPVFFELFCGAMAKIGIRACSHIKASFDAQDVEALQAAHLILLAGGDVRLGWRAIAPMAPMLKARYAAGAVLVGVSAGAVHLGLGWGGSVGEPDRSFLPTLGLAPYLLDAHDEADDWARLKHLVQNPDAQFHGIGIPTGRGLVYHPKHKLEPVGGPSLSLQCRDGVLRESMLFPHQTRNRNTNRGEMNEQE